MLKPFKKDPDVEVKSSIKLGRINTGIKESDLKDSAIHG